MAAPVADARRQAFGLLRVAVAGEAGRVGLPLALVLAEQGHQVRIVGVPGAATDTEQVASIRAGRFPFLEVDGPALLARCLADFPRRLELGACPRSVADCDVVVVTVGTPVDGHLNPSFKVLDESIASLRPFLTHGQTLVFRSAVFPGTSNRILGQLRAGGLDVSCAFCPERLSEGRRVEELRQVPQLVSGSDARALAHVRALFGPLAVDLVELELMEAEVALLFLHAWRYVLFGTANQFYHIATEQGLDFHRIRAAIMHRYARAAGFPRPGFTAGPLLYRDTMQLAAYCRHTFSLGHAAMLENESMPDCLLDQARKELAQRGRMLAGARCGILGMAFKPNSDDCRESLAFKLRQLLLWEGAEVLCSDVHLQREDFVDADELVAHSEFVFIGCPHRAYGALALRPSQRVFDCWGSDAPPPGLVTAGSPGSDSPLTVAVIGGAGHVGLPLSLVLAAQGHHVCIVDGDRGKLEDIRGGRFPFLDAGAPELLGRCLADFPERLRLTDSYAAVRGCDVIVITIGTPVDEHLNPCFSVVEACVRDLRPHLCDGQTLLLRSTLLPGTSARVLAVLRSAGLQAVGVSFCPERVAQGHALSELKTLPQIVSGSDAAALRHARALFGSLGVDLVELGLHEAEVAKLFLNAWRYVGFGTANQFYHIATSKGLDFDRLRAAIMHRYPRAANFPRAGFTAGPCLFKDTMQLAAYCRRTFSLGHAAMLVNETMPDCLVEQARRALAAGGRTLAGARCGILGMAFKPDNDDVRESLAFKLRRLLLCEGAEVLCADARVIHEGLELVPAAELVATSELVFVGCPHREYRELSFGEGQRLFDCWGSTRPGPALKVTKGSSSSSIAPATFATVSPPAGDLRTTSPGCRGRARGEAPGELWAGRAKAAAAEA